MSIIKATSTYRLAQLKLFAIMRESSLENALRISEALLRGNIHALEISYTNPNAGEIIEGVKRRYGSDLIVGAGTVMDSTTARLAVMQGAEFIISNVFDRETAGMCNLYQVPYAPGCTSMSEASEALKAGAAFIKCFPISEAYGPALVKYFKTPTPWIPLMISGGITLDNFEEWAKSGADCFGVGGLLTKGSLKQIEQNALKLNKIIEQI